MVLQMPRPFPHPKTGVYWYRERVPADIKSAAKGQVVTLVIAGRIAQHKIGDELKISLATKDAREAKARHAEVVPQFATIWQGFRDAPAPLSFKNMRALAGELYKSQVARHEDNPGAPEAWDFAEFVALGVPKLIEEDPEGALPLVRDLAKMAGIPFDPETPTMSPELAGLLVQKGIAPPQGGSRGELLGHALAAQGAAAARLARNARGDFSDDPVDRQFPKFVAAVAKPAPKITLTGLLNNWANRLRKPDDRTVSSYTRGEVKSARPWETTTATLSEWVRKTVKVTDKGISPNHAWRHWFKSRGADVGVEELYLDAICGHAATSAGRRYIHPKVTALYREICRFPAFDPKQK